MNHVVWYVIGPSTLRPILRRIILSCGLLPNRLVDLRNSDILGAMSALLSLMPEFVARSLLPIR